MGDIATNATEEPRTTELDMPDPAHSDLPGTQAQEVITAAPAALCLAVLDTTADLVQGSPSLARVIAREAGYAHRLERDRLRQLKRRGGAGDEPWMSTGPVQAILLDPLLARLTGDQRIARVQKILDETEPPSILRDRGPLLLSLIGMLGLLILFRADLIPLLVALSGIAVCCAGAMIPRRRGAYLRRPGELVWPTRYPTISLDDALQLSALNRSPVSPASGAQATAAQPSVGQDMRGPELDQTIDLARRRRAIADVHAAITELDTEWLDYQLDMHAWFLTKPQLRNLNDPIIKAYREAEAELRDRAEELTDTSTDEQIVAARDAARRALKAWGTANRHALKIGVQNLSPSEEAALGTLHGLVGQLNDRATPKEMWPQLIKAITRAMAKLVTVPCTLADIAKLPVIESESRLRAIEERSAYGQLGTTRTDRNVGGAP
ncbi:hypothetical protein E3G68_005115 [Mycobacteroides abscessus]|uniref:hypothetical protein n=1 Tax=Mycobacteroides abscessus TaxID=36809 RepID=UPI001C6CC715|nr:hypothetical protein [Mycobacteroides abscessus]